MTNIHQYVEEYPQNASEDFLMEIVNHGIFNTGADIIKPKNDAEYNEIFLEFENQAKNKLGIN